MPFIAARSTAPRDVVHSREPPVPNLSVSPWTPRIATCHVALTLDDRYLIPLDDEDGDMFFDDLRLEQAPPYATLLMV